MRAAAFVFALVAVAACDDEYIPPKTPTKVAAHEATPTERRDAACQAKELPAPPPINMSDGAGDLPQGKVARVEVDGAKDDEHVRAAIAIAPGDPLSASKTQDAIRHLYALGGVSDVRLEVRPDAQGAILRFVLVKHPALGEVVIHGGTVVDAPEIEKAFHATSGADYDPTAIVQTRWKLMGTLREKGYSDALLSVVGARANDGKVDLCIDLREGAKVTVESIAFRGLAKVKEDELRPLLETDGGRINAPGGVVDQNKLDDSVIKMTEVLDSHGLAKGSVQIKTTRTGDKVALTLEVDEGPVIVVRRYEVKGDLVAPVSAYTKVLSLRSKQPFSRAKLVADIQKIGDVNDSHGHKDFQVQPQTEVDDKNNTVDVTLVVIDPKKATQTAPPPPPKK